MAPDTLAAFRRVIERPHGIVLATGPTGSGKTTTLYASVEHIRTGREKILTVEDPVEYELPGVPQVAVQEQVGLTFANALRSLLRQDPDVLLVGEIRDAETADIAIHAALTGHLVLSTLHTNDAPSAITRLLDLGIPSFLVASTLQAILAQRLVRRVCRDCAATRSPTDEERSVLSLEMAPTVPDARGCEGCRNTGFSGRTGVYELLVMDDTLRKALHESPGASELRRIAVKRGMRPLLKDATRLLLAGETTVDEVFRLRSDEDDAGGV